MVSKYDILYAKKIAAELNKRYVANAQVKECFDHMNVVVKRNHQYSVYPGDSGVIETAEYIAKSAKLERKVAEDFEAAGTTVPEVPDVATLQEDYPSLLVAIDSEKDAEITYKTLIEIEESSTKPNQQVIDLLKKILADELEHIALLSALSASKNSDYVADDAQLDFDTYVADAMNSSDSSNNDGNNSGNENGSVY